MTEHIPNVPFFMMTNEKEFHPGISPSSLKEKPSRDDFIKEIAGLEEAIAATEKRIAKYKEAGVDTSELHSHFKKLEDNLRRTKDKKQETKNN